MSTANSPARGDRPFGAFERMLAFRYLRAKREHGGVALISIISLVGIMLAVMALVVVMSVMNGFRSELLERVLGASAHVEVRGIGNMSTDYVDDLVLDLADIEGVQNVYPVVEDYILASQGNASFGAFARGLSRDAVENMDFITEGFVKGGLTDFALGDRGGNTVLLGETLANYIFGEPGRQVTLLSPRGRVTIAGSKPTQKAYTVGGSFKVQTFNPLDQFLVVMPLEQAQLFFLRGESYDKLELVLDDPNRANAVADLVRKKLPDGLRVYGWEDNPQNAAYMSALAIERSMMRIIFLILITITALNIITGVVMLVKNKSRDIAILRTIGASRGAMTRVFIMVGAILGILGTTLGLVLGLLFCWNIAEIQGVLEAVFNFRLAHTDIYGIPHLPARIDWFEVSLATVWAFVMSIAVTIWPAWRAANMDPVEALRFE